MARGTASRLLNDWAGAHLPVWSPDGHRVLFASNRLGGVDLFQIAADGSAPDTLVHRSREGNVEVTDWSLDGRLASTRRTVMATTTSWRFPSPAPASHGRCWRRPPTRSMGSSRPTAAGSPTRATNPDPRSLRAAVPWGGQSQGVDARRGSATLAARRPGVYYLAPDGGLMAVPVAARTGSIRDRPAAYAVRHGHHWLVRRSAQPVRGHPRWDALPR